MFENKNLRKPSVKRIEQMPGFPDFREGKRIMNREDFERMCKNFEWKYNVMKKRSS